MIEQEKNTTSQDHRYFKPKAPHRPSEEQQVELFASIKKSSEYHHEDLDQSNNNCIFKIDAIRPDSLCFRMKSNNYSSHDLAFYVKDTKGNLIPLAGGVSK